ncbi:MAG: hypothetical protein AB1330_12985 [Bacillota bacterium]
MREENKSEGYSLNWETLKLDWPLGVILAGLIGKAVLNPFKASGSDAPQRGGFRAADDLGPLPFDAPAAFA